MRQTGHVTANGATYVTGRVTANVTANVIGHVTANGTTYVTGHVTANVSGQVTADGTGFLWIPTLKSIVKAAEVKPTSRQHFSKDPSSGKHRLVNWEPMDLTNLGVQLLTGFLGTFILLHRDGG